MNDTTPTSLTPVAEATLVALRANETLLRARENFTRWEAQVEETRGELALAAPDDQEAKDQAEGAAYGLTLAREKLAQAEAGNRLAEKRLAEAKAAAEAERLAAVGAEGFEHTKAGLDLAKRTLAALRTAAEVTGPLDADWRSWSAQAQHLRHLGGMVARFSTPSDQGRAWVEFTSGLRAVTNAFYSDVQSVSQAYGLSDEQESVAPVDAEAEQEQGEFDEPSDDA